MLIIKTLSDIDMMVSKIERVRGRLLVEEEIILVGTLWAPIDGRNSIVKVLGKDEMGNIRNLCMTDGDIMLRAESEFQKIYWRILDVHSNNE